ncbi:FGGY family carbohydrate kinase [Saccharothrix violaceirubra]|uniref:Gluconokinase n=1 Tax=Saccharothrix violaceirubra TaxID=413306 RepID=A0A7W7T9F1_9PSEU|nr:gluconokinase [Saccharothrix violaceirubra]MBB4968994.1 gluconokinase [Saccharothrix violaceirubra]
MADVVLAIDQGTTATKVSAVDRHAHVLVSAERSHPVRTTPAGEATHDPGEVVDAALDALREVAAAGHHVHALALTGAMHTLLGVDGAGRPVTPSLSWADNRAKDQAQALRDTDLGRRLHRETGTPVHPFAPLAKLAWAGANKITADRWYGLKDHLFRALTGEVATEHSSASGTGLLESATLDWHPDALDFAGIDPEKLPDLRSPLDSAPLTRHVPGVPRDVPVVLGGGDGPLANLGVGATTPGVAAVSLGTSGALRVARDAPIVDERGRTFCYYVAEGLWVVGGAVSNGGIVTQWAADTFGLPAADLLAEAALVPPGARGITALPYLLGERAPWWTSDARSALVGIRHDHGRAEITRALVEGVAQQLALVLDAVRSTADVRTARVTGGAFRSPLWTEVLASALDLDLEVATGDSAVGAALLAWRALEDRPPTPAHRPGRIFRPDKDIAELYRRGRQDVERLYLALR